MPIYEYRCAACGHELEMLQKLSEAPLVDCPACGKGALTKLVSAAGFQLKGSGWYATDYGRSKSATSDDSNTANGKSSDSSTSTASSDKGSSSSEKSSASSEKSSTSSEKSSSSSSASD